MNVEEKIYVSMTSWYKRIGNVNAVINSLLSQTVKPYKIILNLCTEDFPNMEEDLPDDLIETILKNPNIEIYWFIENYKAWKKHLHVLEIVSDDDLIISVDDDHLYPNDFIEKMYISYCFYGKDHPVTLNKIMLCHNLWTYNGPATLHRRKDWGDYKKYLTYNVLHKCYEDIFITILFAINHVYILPEIFHLPDDEDMLYNDSNAFSDPKSVKNNNEDITAVKSMIDATLMSMEESLKLHYFNNKVAPRYIPHFWDIVQDLVDDIKKKDSLFPCEKFIIDSFDKNFLKGNLYNVDFKSLNLDIERHDKSYYIGENNKLVITISSWNKRINNVLPVIKRIYYGTMTPDRIVINLAKEDFGVPINENVNIQKLVENGIFPKDLYEFICRDSVFRIHWHNDAKLKSWKKYAYVAKHYKDNDVIIAIDDDVLYKETFVETMVKSYYEYGRKHCVSIFTSFCEGSWGLCGYGFLFTPKALNITGPLFNEEIMHKFPEDNHLVSVVSYNKMSVMPVIGYNFLFYNTNFNSGEASFGNSQFDDKWWKSYKDIMSTSIELFKNNSEGRQEKNYGWNPYYFNFTIGSLIEYLQTTDREKLSVVQKEVYDTTQEYLKTMPGAVGSCNDISSKLENVIL